MVLKEDDRVAQQWGFLDYLDVTIVVPKLI